MAAIFNIITFNKFILAKIAIFLHFDVPLFVFCLNKVKLIKFCSKIFGKVLSIEKSLTIIISMFG